MLGGGHLRRGADGANTCKRLGVEQTATKHDVAPTPEVAAVAYATEVYPYKAYGVARQQAAYQGCLAGFRSR
jgi:hypothetical protein